MHTVDHIVENGGEVTTVSRGERWIRADTVHTEQASGIGITAGPGRLGEISGRAGANLVHNGLWKTMWMATLVIVHTGVDRSVDKSVVARRSGVSWSS